MLPLTRNRGDVGKGERYYVPSDLQVEYYAQRATKGGMLITEATPISPNSCGYSNVPGIWTDEQVAGWKKIVDAVHAKGGLIVCQLWHVGRATMTEFLPGDMTPVSASDIPMSGICYMTADTPWSASKIHALSQSEIKTVVGEYVHAAKNAIAAGFDAVEVHGANGYLVEQFLSSNSNNRTDEYGGSAENRARFGLEVVDAVVAAVGADHTGIRLSPWSTFGDMYDENRYETWGYFAKELAKRNLAYMQWVMPRADEVPEEPELKKQYEAALGGKGLDMAPLREAQGHDIPFLVGNGNLPDTCAELVSSGQADAVGFGRWFIANPDLVYRIEKGLPVNQYDRSTFYGPLPDQSKGYTDYPFAK